jgi:hypothetical protein
MPDFGYRITEIVPALGIVTQSFFGRQCWTKCKMTKHTRESRQCAMCKGPLGKEAFRPITNGNNRMERICLECGSNVSGKP